MPENAENGSLENNSDKIDFSEYFTISPEEQAERVRQEQKRKRIARFREFNPIAWFWDDLPYQERYLRFDGIRRTTRQEFYYHWLRRRTNWIALSKFKSKGVIYFAAISGLISLVIQIAPLSQPNHALPFKWLLFAGMLYLIAIAFYEILCPSLLKEVLSKKDDYVGEHGRRWFRAMVEDELRRWWCKREWIPQPYHNLDMDRTDDATVMGIMSGYGTPAYCGFGPYACAQIEFALDELSKSQDFKIWTGVGTDAALFRPSYAYEGNRPLVRRFSFYAPSDYDIQKNSKLSPNDLIIDIYDSNVDISERAPSNKDVIIENDIRGLQFLFNTDSRSLAFSQIMGYLQEFRYPLRRFILLLLYIGSFLSGITFVVLETISLFTMY